MSKLGEVIGAISQQKMPKGSVTFKKEMRQSFTLCAKNCRETCYYDIIIRGRQSSLALVKGGFIEEKTLYRISKMTSTFVTFNCRCLLLFCICLATTKVGKIQLLIYLPLLTAFDNPKSTVSLSLLNLFFVQFGKRVQDREFSVSEQQYQFTVYTHNPACCLPVKCCILSF